MSVPMANGAPAAAAVARRLHVLYPSLPVFVGGGAPALDSIDGIALPGSVVRAAHDVAVRLRPAR